MSLYGKKCFSVLMALILLLTWLSLPSFAENTVPQKVNLSLLFSSMPGLAQDEDSAMLYLEQEDHVEIVQYAGYSATVTVPASIAGKPVTVVSLEKCGIGAWGQFFQGIRRVILPDTVIRLDDQAFYALQDLEEVQGLEYVQELGKFVFEQCGLREARFSAKLREVGEHAFSDGALERVTIPDDFPIDKYQQLIFTDSLEELSLLRGKKPATIKLVGETVFSADGKTLVRVLPFYRKLCYEVPDGVELIKHDAFFALNMVQEYVFPDSVNKIENVNFIAYDDERIIVSARKGSYAWQFFSERKDNSYHMRDLSDEKTLSELVGPVIAKVIQSGMSNWEKAFALHNWILENTEYDHTFTHFDAEGVFLYGTGTCDGYSRAYGALLDAAGIENRYVACMMQDELHAINAVKLDGEWCYVDCTNDDKGTVGAPYYLFGFNDVLYRQVYQGGTGLTSTATAHYAPFRKGVLKQEEEKLISDIKSSLDNGTTVFSVTLGNTVGRFPAWMLASEMTGRMWTVNGREHEIDCRVNQSEGSAGSLSISLKMPVVNGFIYVDNQDGGICLTRYAGSATTVTVPETLDGRPVTALKGTFKGQEQLKKVILPEGLKEIGDSTFEGCLRLETVNFPSTLIDIGKNAFGSCGLLSSDITLPYGLRSIGDGAFNKCTSIPSAVLPGTVADMGIEVFYSCQGLSRVTMKNGNRSITDGMFAGCIHLGALTLPDTLETIGLGAFTGSGLTFIDIPASVTEIHPTALLYTRKIRKLTVDPGNKNYQAKDNMLLSRDGKVLIAATCGVNPDLTIPAGVEEIGRYAFVFVPLIRITIPSGVKIIGEAAFAGENQYTTVTMADTVEEIGPFAFAALYNYGNGYIEKRAEHNSLASVRLSRNLKKIGKHAFYGARLKQLVIPDSMTDISESIINYQTALYIPETVTHIAEQDIMYDADKLEIYGKAGSAAAKYASSHQLSFYDTGANLSFESNDLMILTGEDLKLQIYYGNRKPIDISEVVLTCEGDSVSLKDGVVHGVQAGKSVITATWKGQTGTCQVYVGDPEEYWFLGSHNMISEDGMVLLPGQFHNLDFEVMFQGLDEPTVIMNDHVQWSVSDKNVLCLACPGTVEAVGNGMATLSVKAPNGMTYSLLIHAVGPGTDPEPEIVPESELTEHPAFHDPAEFILPAAAKAIGEGAFEGNLSINVMDARNCTSIGADAFKGCTGLFQLRLPQNCAIDSTAFDGCQNVYIFAPAGGTTEAFCTNSNTCIFIAEKKIQ